MSADDPTHRPHSERLGLEAGRLSHGSFLARRPHDGFKPIRRAAWYVFD